ncbi:MAG: hypothetical protein NUW37_06485 [Planctomycetes bacterium]|nr:hypothetical protein [Planctomycetota bacterium]
MRRFIAAIFALTFIALGADSALAQTQQELEGLASQIITRNEGIRGLNYEHEVAVGIKTRQELHDYFGEQIAQEVNDEVIHGELTTYWMLGFFEKDVDLVQAYTNLYGGAVAGFYDPETKHFYIVERGNERPTPEQIANEFAMRMMGTTEREMVMSHELHHACQDQHYDLLYLQKRIQGSSDQNQALKCLIEGDASCVQYMFVFRGNEAGVDQAARGSVQGNARASGNFDGVPLYLQESIIVPYTWGFDFTWKLYRNGGWAAVDAAFANPPASMEQVLHPEEKFFGDKREDPTQIDFENIHDVFGDDWKLLGSDTLGEFDMRLMYRYHGQADKANDIAEGWQGDKYYCVENEDGVAILVWATTWDTEKDAQDFATSYVSVLENKRGVTGVRPRGNTFVYAADGLEYYITRTGNDVVIAEGIPGSDIDIRNKVGELKLKKEGYRIPEISRIYNDPARHGLQLFENRYLGAEVPLLDGWTLDEESSRQNYGPIVLSGREGTIRVEKVFLEGRVDMQKFSDEVVHKISSRTRDFKLFSTDHEKLGKRDAFTIQFTATVGGTSRYYRQTYVRAGSWIFVFSGIGSTQNWEAARDRFEEVMEEAATE